MQCPNCRAAIADDVLQCGNCGSNVAVMVTSPDGQQFGPYSLRSLRQYQSDGRIRGDWVATMGGGSRTSVQQLLASAAGPPAPTPAVTPPAPRPAVTPPPAPAAPAPPAGVPQVPGAVTGAPATKKRSAVWSWVIGYGIALLIVVVILAAVLAPVFSRARALAVQVMCEVYLEELGEAVEDYAADHGGALCSADGWQEQLKAYVQDETVFKCPETERDYEMNPALSGQNVQQIAAGERTPDTIPLFYDAGFPNGEPPHPEGWEVCFLDGSCRVVSKKQAAHYSGE